MIASYIRVTSIRGAARKVECLDKDGNVLCELPCTLIERAWGPSGPSDAKLRIMDLHMEYVDG